MPPISQTLLDAIDRDRTRARRRELAVKTLTWGAIASLPTAGIVLAVWTSR